MLRTSDLKTISLNAILFAQKAVAIVIGYDPLMTTPISKAITAEAFNNRELQAVLLGKIGEGLPDLGEILLQSLRLAREVARETDAQLYRSNEFIAHFAAMYTAEAMKNPTLYDTLLEWKAKPEKGSERVIPAPRIL